MKCKKRDGKKYLCAILMFSKIRNKTDNKKIRGYYKG